ncbi:MULTISPECIES: M1 family metallopeptidase [Aequorivita]|uniref:M1 family metallopeptidase n=1 Tax=Aequorivita iocasae TaxID=2803865 RepID=A0ABX7DVQ2_9FLAO|nr:MULTISPECIES: M1 family metallopeptidase [Aequorivita]QQX78255.1 M1 family metallopeptidase [Aequorivita iocasae]UCA57675.1 M1 family metallopeptidase [Aequorivita sp. F7]
MFFVAILFLFQSALAQKFTRADTLIGSITPERAWWDVTHYDLKVTVNPSQKTIKGSNTISYKVLEPNNIMQIDLQTPMKIDKILQDGKKITYTSEGNAHFLKLQKKQIKGSENNITIYFSGKPTEAVRPPWDGGFTWTKDSNGKPFIATSNQGIGSSVWWPLKDHPSEEPDNGVTIAVTTPKDLMDVSNGRLIKVSETDSTKTWTWQVVNPINAYGVDINIGDYVHWGEKYKGEKGMLDMDYYVLRENEAKAKEQFKQAPKMMEAFEHWFGPYPFYEDGYKLVEAPYLGMEHQSSVTYGNKFKNGYLGRDLSGTGWGLKFDFIIIHESGHEWFANNITNKDVADMWIHEGFTNYSENLYLDYFFGKKASSEYVVGIRNNISNDRPIIGIYNVDYEGSGDMYYKGANILHTIRQLVDDDEKWRKILRGLNKEFYHQTVTTKQVEDYISKESGIDLSVFWNQYLRTTMIPKLEYTIDGKTLKFRYVNIVDDFKMPIIAVVKGKEEWIYPTSEWKTKKFPAAIETVEIKKDFYVNSEEIKQ